MPREDLITIENARIAFRNFEGKAKQYNKEGDRNFCILLDQELAEHMREAGWNIKHLKPRDEDYENELRPYIQVSVNYKGRPPRIVLISSKGRTPIDEDLVQMLDHVDVQMVDLTLRPYDWTVSGNTGRKAYLKTMFLTMAEDEIELKYAEDPSPDDNPEF